ncbi:hypothetical protein D3C71_1718610 [compost metagenome]
MDDGVGLSPAELDDPLSGSIVAIPFTVIEPGRAVDGGDALQLIARIPDHRLSAGHQVLQVAVCIEVTAEVGSFLTLFPWQGAVALWVDVHQATERIFITFMAQRGPVAASVVLVMFDVVEQAGGIDGAGDVQFR